MRKDISPVQSFGVPPGLEEHVSRVEVRQHVSGVQSQHLLQREQRVFHLVLACDGMV
jgi:hypothetical protein